ncbi:MAG: RtcB family protein [Planctomycetes bacterium]|nr:RtcB family protein [Planctomycetota bacterium]
MGVPRGLAMKAAIECAAAAARVGMDKEAIRSAVASLLARPADYAGDRIFGPLAEAVAAAGQARSQYQPREQPAPWRQWGEGFEETAVQQMRNACSLPVAVAGALMPDAHQGYGLPIGGVLAVDNAVIPYAVGVDIACRMKLTVLDLPVSALAGQRDRLAKAIERETFFGVGSENRGKRQHAVMDEDWSVTPATAGLKDKAAAQLGTSGSGNHFVEFGTLTLDHDDLGLKAGVYLALLSHSGSRGTGAGVADHYSRLAMNRHPELPRELGHLAWLGLDSAEGQEYWSAMQLMGRYAAANHELIHRGIAKNLGAAVLLDIENHHNFAWRETHAGREVIVHRKGATPAGTGAIGIIPGSMGTPGYVIRGRGKAESLNSASHGAGRKMSRKAAKERFAWSDARKFLAEHNVELLSAGLDEVPMAYKDIETVMAAQADLVETIARFDPRLVKMAPGGERAED